MPKQSNAIVTMPSVVQNSLRELGENLSIARERRRELINVLACQNRLLKEWKTGTPVFQWGFTQPLYG
jgi:hypothetical protein